MANVTIEYVILIPLLFTQVIVFPLVASAMTSNWENQQRDVELQDVADHLASTIQQLYLTASRDEILAGTITHASPAPTAVSSYRYTATGSLTNPPDPNSTKILTVTLMLEEVGNIARAQALLGPDVQWVESTLQSSSSGASIVIQKFSNGTLVFSFGG